jgi:hypothetical protein
LGYCFFELFLVAGFSWKALHHPRTLFVSWFGLNSGRSFTLSSLEFVLCAWLKHHLDFLIFFGSTQVNNQPFRKLRNT